MLFRSDDIPPNGLPPYVDVRVCSAANKHKYIIYTDIVQDIAKAHVLALDSAAASNQRIIISAGLLGTQRIADVLRATVPDAAERVPRGQPGTDNLPVNNYTIDNTKSKEILGLEYRSAEETFGDLGKQLLEIEKGQ